MRTSTGLSTEAIYIFHNMLRKLRTEYKPQYIAAVFESGRTFREESYAEYKATGRRCRPTSLNRFPTFAA